MAGRPITLVDAPTSAGAYAPGQEEAPAALRAAGLVAALEAAGATVGEGGSAAPFRWRPDPSRPRAANADAVGERAREVAALVAAAPSDDLVVVLGGDCTTGVGTVAGLVARGLEPGLVYLDRHADLQRPQTTDEGALDWMGVAHLLDLDGAVDELAGIGARRPLLTAEQVSFLGLGPLPAAEEAVVAELALARVPVDALAADPVTAARAAVAPLDGRADLAVHFDADVVDFLDAPLAENTDRGTAPSLAATGEALATLLGEHRVRALTVTEHNPRHGEADGSTSRRLVDVLVAALA